MIILHIGGFKLLTFANFSICLKRAKKTLFVILVPTFSVVFKYILRHTFAHFVYHFTVFLSLKCGS